MKSINEYIIEASQVSLDKFKISDNEKIELSKNVNNKWLKKLLSGKYNDLNFYQGPINKMKNCWTFESQLKYLGKKHWISKYFGKDSDILAIIQDGLSRKTILDDMCKDYKRIDSIEGFGNLFELYKSNNEDKYFVIVRENGNNYEEDLKGIITSLYIKYDFD